MGLIWPAAAHGTEISTALNQGNIWTAFHARAPKATVLTADLPWVMGDCVQLQQVLMNPVMNSVDAIKNVDGWSGSFLDRFSGCSYSRDRYSHVDRGGRHALKSTWYFAYDAWLAVSSCYWVSVSVFSVEIRFQRETRPLWIWRKNSCRLYHPCRNV